MKFASPWSLLLLLVLPLWLWWQRRSARRGGLKFSSVAAARSLSSVWSALGPLLLFGLRGATLALFVAALARPQLGRSESKVRTEGIDIVLVIDISGSMQAMDYEKLGQRQSRIDAVKEVVREFIRSRASDRIGMVVFGTHAYVASPLTLDHDWLERNLDRVKIGLVEGNTAIGAGIGTAVNRLRDTKAKSKVIVLLTDGGENVKNPPALDAAKAAKEFNVRVYTVGAGSRGIAPMPVYDQNGNLLGYQPIQADLDEDLLRQIASATGGQYFRAADKASLKKTYAQIDAMEKQKVETLAYEEWQELFPWFLAPGLGCLVLAVTLEHTRLRRLP
ncbi:MAG TPA: VWA domain-containing protein [Verrucomicrobiae bacterium]|nr:VWA domain-containing protein [Verrucomicrobiae bacterium]